MQAREAIGQRSGIGSPDARGARRQQTMFVVGRLTSSEGERVCLVRNISPTGIGIEHDGGLAIDQRVVVETRCMLPTGAVVRWANATHAGLEFLEPPKMLHAAAGLGARDARILRTPRFSLDCAVQVSIDGTILNARACDIALGGLRLTDLDTVPDLVPARVLLPGRSIPGRIRWTRTVTAGFQFATPLSSRELSAVLAQPECVAP